MGNFWYEVTFLPLQPGTSECWAGQLRWVGEADSPEQADHRARLASGHGPEVKSFVVVGQTFGWG